MDNKPKRCKHAFEIETITDHLRGYMENKLKIKMNLTCPDGPHIELVHEISMRRNRVEVLVVAAVDQN